MKKLNRIGAEAVISEVTFEGKKVVQKKRSAKNYRNSLLDSGIRKKRTRAEAKIITEVSSVVCVPRIISVDENKGIILMELIKGKRLKEVIEKNPSLCVIAGKEIKKIHSLGIIHGDLTTSNIIVEESANGGRNKKQKASVLCFIDFGLGFYSKKLEAVATDLVVFKKTFNATHSSLKNGWTLVMKGYAPSKELEAQMQKIEKRARYH